MTSNGTSWVSGAPSFDTSVNYNITGDWLFNGNTSINGDSKFIFKKSNTDLLEGGEFLLEMPNTTNLLGNVAIDIANDSLRIFEDKIAADGRGYSLDITYGTIFPHLPIVVSPNAVDYTVTDYPLGTILTMYGGTTTFLLNTALAPIRTGGASSNVTVYNGTGSTLSGTWRTRGLSGADGTLKWYLIQRVA